MERDVMGMEYDLAALAEQAREQWPAPSDEDVQTAWALGLWDTLRDSSMREDPDALMR